MSYGPSEHAIWAERVKNLMRALHDLALNEGQKIDLIYLNEGGNIADPDFIATSYASTDQLISAVTTIRELKSFIDGTGSQPSHGDRTSRFAPFLQ